MIKKIFKVNAILSIFIFILTLFSCGSDDDNAVILNAEERAAADDAAIESFLNSYYFDEYGKITLKGNIVDKISQNNKVSLKDYAKPIEGTGIWYVIRPSYEGKGLAPDASNNILIHYTLNSYISEANGNYTLQKSYSSINGSGLPEYNPYFYKAPKDSTWNKYLNDYFISEGLIKGLEKFLPTNKDKMELYDLQGIILVPSRLAYPSKLENQAESFNNYYSFSSTNFLMLNFELYKVCPVEDNCDK